MTPPSHEINPTVEAWMLDVGQGTANIIRLGFGRGIVIDTGPEDTFVPLTMLKQERIDFIEAMVVSHNHNDHDGGVLRILQAYPRKIKRLYFIQDGPAESIRSFDFAMAEFDAGRLLRKPLRLEARPDAWPIYPWPGDEHEKPPPPSGFRMHVLHPHFADSLRAERDERSGQARSNRQSGIVALGWGDSRLIFPGDASIEAWEAVGEDFEMPLTCDVIAAPHHGGHIASQRPGESRAAFQARRLADIRHLYGHFVKPRYVVFSVGSSNRFSSTRHPLPESVGAACAAGATVVCTQMTPQCCTDLEAVRPALVPLTSPSRASTTPSFTGAGVSRNVGCMGTVMVSITADGLAVEKVGDHQLAVDRLATQAHGRPMCRAMADAVPSSAP